MKEMGWDKQTQVAAAARVSRQAVTNWMGRNGTIDFEPAYNLQVATRFNARWIMTGDGEQRIAELTKDEIALLERYRTAPEVNRRMADAALTATFQT